MNTELLTLYDTNSLISNVNGSIKELLLSKACISGKKCWGNGIDDAEEWNKISLPYIGRKYGQLCKIVVVGINTNECGGINALNDMLVKSQYAIMKGNKRIQFDNEKSKYRGTDVYYRVALYSSIILSKIYMKDISEYEALDYIGYLNSIKCSPCGNNGRPTTEMHLYCPSIYMKKELEVLDPDIVISLGHHTVEYKLYENEAFIMASDDDSIIDYYKISINNHDVKLFKTYHPSNYFKGGNSDELTNRYSEFIKSVLTKT